MCCHDRVTALISQDSDLFENFERYRQDESSSPCATTLCEFYAVILDLHQFVVSGR
jgi:hypothetical protein